MTNNSNTKTFRLIIRSNTKLYDLIQNSFKKNIWLVESDSNDRRFLENLFLSC